MPGEKRFSILIVDADPVDRFIHTKLIQHLDNAVFEIQVAEHGQQALAFIHQKFEQGESFDFILIDLDMVLDGVNFLKNFSTSPHFIPAKIIALTHADNESPEIRNAKASGITNVYRKPMCINQLKEALRLNT